MGERGEYSSRISCFSSGVNCFMLGGVQRARRQCVVQRLFCASRFLHPQALRTLLDAPKEETNKRAHVSVEDDQHYASMVCSGDRPACMLQESSRLKPTLILARVVENRAVSKQ